MNLNLTLLGQAFTFGIFIWFTMKYVWPPIMQAIDERQKKIADGLAAAVEGQEAKKNADKLAHDELAAARKKAADIIEQANKRGEQIIAEAKNEAKTQGEHLLEQAQVQIVHQTTQAREALRREVANIAIASTEKLLERTIDGDVHQDLIDKFAAEI